MEREDINTFEADWKKELEDKSIEELAIIIANQHDYKPAFVEMAQQKLKSHSDYDEEKVRTIITHEEEKKRIREKNKGMSIWLLLFLCGVAISGIYTLFQTWKAISQYWDDYNFPLLAYVISYTICMCFLCGYTFWALVKKLPNAVTLAKVYLWVSVVVNVIKILQHFNYNEIPSIRTLWGLVVGILWLLYFKYSKHISERYPIAERAFARKERFVIVTLLIVPVVMFVWSAIVSPSYSLDTVVDGMDLSDIDQPSYLIDGEKLNENEVTDGISIITIPEGVICKKDSLEDDTKLIYFLDEKDANSYEIRFVSGVEDSFDSMRFNETWSVRKDYEIEDATYEIIRDDVSDVNTYKCYRRTSQCKAAETFFWEYIILFDYRTHKFCYVNVVYPKNAIVPIDQVVDGIRFQQ